MKKTRSAAKGRISSILRATAPNLDFIIEAKKVLSQLPGVAPNIPSIVCAGFPNVGKSTLVNSLLGKERMIVSPVPGTTRDAVDAVCSYYKKEYIIIDTAGIRRKGRMAKTAERYSFLRTLRNIENIVTLCFSYLMPPKELLSWIRK